MSVTSRTAIGRCFLPLEHRWLKISTCDAVALSMGRRRPPRRPRPSNLVGRSPDRRDGPRRRATRPRREGRSGSGPLHREWGRGLGRAGAVLRGARRSAGSLGGQRRRGARPRGLGRAASGFGSTLRGKAAGRILEIKRSLTDHLVFSDHLVFISPCAVPLLPRIHFS